MNEKNAQDVLEELFTRLSKTTHDLNNPLSIISGNAQFLKGMVHTMELGDEVLEPVEDIEEACQRIADSLDRLDALKEEVDAHRLGNPEGSGE